MTKLKWGVLGAAKIAVEKVIPAMTGSNTYEVAAIASRTLKKAQAAAQKLGISKSYGSYEELIADPEIQVIYIPLPNHLHVEYTLQCIEAGKHVLCEKPLSLNSIDVHKLIRARDKKGVKVGEAFMVRTHPQWLKTRELIQEGALGKLKMIQGCFSYFNVNPDNIRNIEAYGGGALWDIGVYPINTARFVLDEEPLKVISLVEEDKSFGTDVLTSVMMKFPSCHAQFYVSTQLVPYQRMHFFGDKQQLEVKIPFNAPNNRNCQIILNEGDLFEEQTEAIRFDTCDQYRLQADAFSKAILENILEPAPLEDTLANTMVVEAIFKSAKDKCWVELD